MLNVIHNENCLETMARMDDDFIHLVVTSPPYDNMRAYDGNVFNQFEKIANVLYRVVAPGGVVVWVVGDQTIDGNETGTSFRQALYFKKIGFNLFDTMIYAKPPCGAVGNNNAYWQSFEYMFVFSKGNPRAINLIYDRDNIETRPGDNGNKRVVDGSLVNMKRGGYGNTGRRTNIWQYAVGKGHSTKDDIAFCHPAIFPEKLAGDHIKSWSNPGDIVYDPFMGSGTTAKMAILNKRQWIGSEISQEYCSIIRHRINLLL